MVRAASGSRRFSSFVSATRNLFTRVFSVITRPRRAAATSAAAAISYSSIKQR
jgi:hypothetical protein